MTDTSPSQKNSSRRALKAVAAGTLGLALLGGLGTTFAKWYEEESLNGSLQTGHLNMTVEDGQWVDVNHKNKTITAEDFRMVPGDKIKYTAQVKPDLVGDNLSAQLSVNVGEAVLGELKDVVTVKTTVDGEESPKTITSEAGKTTIPVTVELEFPLTKDGAKPDADKSNWWNDQGENKTVNLSGIEIELDQVDNPSSAAGS